MYRQNANEYGYQHHMGQGDFLHPPIPPVGYRGAVHPVPQPTSRPFIARGGVGFKPPAPHHNRPPFGVPGASTSPRFRGTNPLSGHRPPHRGMGYTRGRGSFTTKQNQHSNQSKQTIDPFAPTPEDYDVSSQLQQMLNDCFPEGCKPWIAKDLPAKIEAHIAEIINERYFFAHVTNGLPGIEIKEMTRKMGDKAFIDGAEPYTDPTIRRCAALYSDNPEEQPPELFRAWIKDLSEDDQCEVFFIDWGNISKQSRDNLSVIKDIHWTMRPQIVLFRMNDTSSLPRNMKVTLKVLTESVYEKNYVVPVELTEE